MKSSDIKIDISSNEINIHAYDILEELNKQFENGNNANKISEVDEEMIKKGYDKSMVKGDLKAMVMYDQKKCLDDTIWQLRQLTLKSLRESVNKNNNKIKEKEETDEVNMVIKETKEEKLISNPPVLHTVNSANKPKVNKLSNKEMVKKKSDDSKKNVKKISEIEKKPSKKDLEVKNNNNNPKEENDNNNKINTIEQQPIQSSSPNVSANVSANVSNIVGSGSNNNTSNNKYSGNNTNENKSKGNNNINPVVPIVINSKKNVNIYTNLGEGNNQALNNALNTEGRSSEGKKAHPMSHISTENNEEKNKNLDRTGSAHAKAELPRTGSAHAKSELKRTGSVHAKVELPRTGSNAKKEDVGNLQNNKQNNNGSGTNKKKKSSDKLALEKKNEILEADKEDSKSSSFRLSRRDDEKNNNVLNVEVKDDNQVNKSGREKTPTKTNQGKNPNIVSNRDSTDDRTLLASPKAAKKINVDSPSYRNNGKDNELKKSGRSGISSLDDSFSIKASNIKSINFDPMKSSYASLNNKEASENQYHQKVFCMKNINIMEHEVQANAKYTIRDVDESTLLSGRTLQINAAGLKDGLRHVRDGYAFFGVKEKYVKNYIIYIKIFI